MSLLRRVISAYPGRYPILSGLIGLASAVCPISDPRLLPSPPTIASQAHVEPNTTIDQFLALSDPQQQLRRSR